MVNANFQTSAFMRVADALRREIEEEFLSIGILCRVFGRGKSERSLRSKLGVTPDKYFPGGKLLQDAIGLRVVLYFQEDVRVVERILRLKYQCDDVASTIDRPSNTEFSVSRYNLIFGLPEIFYRDVPSATVDLPIDRTFEVQIRTILSEGWHEVEHDLRYKRKGDWLGFDELSRGLNGVVATLETAEWSMRKIFDELAYKHYKRKNWDAMLHSMLRMRIVAPLSSGVCEVLDSDPTLARKVSRVKRGQVFDSLYKLAPRLPVSADNVLFVCNRVFLASEALTALTPRIVSETMDGCLL